MTQRYLIHFAQQHAAFRITEFEALASLFSIKFRYLEPPSVKKPYLLLETSDELLLKRTVSRSPLVKSLIELWGSGRSFDEFKADSMSSPQLLSGQFSSADRSFSIVVKPFGKTYSRKQIVDKINSLSFLKFLGPVKIESPDNLFHLIEYYGEPPKDVSDEPRNIYFGRVLTAGSRSAVDDLSLKKRKFISTTSMDAELSLIMANIAQVDSSKLVLDPFCGTGSILIAASYYGAHSFGSDIDWPLLHGKSKPTKPGVKKRDADENVFGNFKQYDLTSKYVDVILADAAILEYSSRALFDAIITDPPYGIREGSERVGRSERHSVHRGDEQNYRTHFPAKTQYNLCDVIRDLMDFSATRLVPRGRLVFWVPVFKGEGSEPLEEQLPHHPAFQLVATCVQLLTKAYCRVLIVMELKDQSEFARDASGLNGAHVPESHRDFRTRLFPTKQIVNR